jgi:hypothetical protein
LINYYAERIIIIDENGIADYSNTFHSVVHEVKRQNEK